MGSAMSQARSDDGGREGGSIDQLPSGALRVRLSAGFDAVT